MKNKKVLIALVVLLLIRGVSGTVAFFTETDTVVNEFDSGQIKAYVTENFTSPSDWRPGSTTNTSVIATNPDNVLVAVRISLNEEWIGANDEVLPNEVNDLRVAILNFNNSNWIKEGDYYYYYKSLAKNESTDSLISSVTYNPSILGTTSCVESNDGSNIKCINTSGYEGATYTLTTRVELVQYRNYKASWNTNVEIE